MANISIKILRQLDCIKTYYRGEIDWQEKKYGK